jgi:hygromycin-B 4-O-kinase
MPALRDFEQLAEGEESQAYRFREGSDAFVIRINHDGEGFEKDAFAYRRFARHELPIPEVLQIGQIDAAHYYCISRMLPGRTLESLAPEEFSAGLLTATADAMQRIAESDVSGIDGFGPFAAAEGTARHGSWREYLSDTREYVFPPEWDVSRYLRQLERLVPKCAEVRALVHGDFGSNNVLTVADRITGVLDWSEAMIGDPLYDIANIFFWRSWLPCMEMQARFSEAAQLEQAREPLLCYQLHIGLRELAARSMISEWICDRLDSLLAIG